MRIQGFAFRRINRRRGFFISRRISGTRAPPVFRRGNGGFTRYTPGICGKIISVKITSLFILTLCLCPSARALENKRADIIYKISIPDPARGLINVEVLFNEVPPGGLVLSELGSSGYLNLSGLKAKYGSGVPLEIRSYGEGKPGFKKKEHLIKNAAVGMKVEYAVRPGAVGRHGHIGYLDGRFGLIEGKNLFLFPRDAAGFNGITVEFKLPEGWEAVCPWKKTGGVFAIERDYYGYGLDTRTVLDKAVIGFGNFRSCEKEIDGFKARIYAFSGWSPERSASICERAFKLTEYQVKLFGFNKRWDYTVIFVPEAADKERRVFGGSYSLGQGYEMEKLTSRRWELFSHRLHHVFNAYPPLGMSMDTWFAEAGASYYEIKALSSLGYYKLEDRLFRLYGSYKSGRAGNDAPLSSEPEPNSKKENFLHYTKAPLVAYLLDEKIKKNTKGEKDLDLFLRHIYSERAMRKGALNLREELEKFTGAGFGDFFEKYVDGAEKIKLKFGLKRHFASNGKTYLILLLCLIALSEIFSALRARGKAKNSSNLVK